MNKKNKSIKDDVIRPKGYFVWLASGISSLIPQILNPWKQKKKKQLELTNKAAQEYMDRQAKIFADVDDETEEEAQKFADQQK